MTGPQPPLTFEYSWSLAEHAKAQHDIFSNRFKTEGLAVFFWIAAGIVLLGNAVAVYLATQDQDQYLGWSLPVTLVLVVAFWYLSWGRGWVSAYQQRRTDSSLQYPIFHLFSENGLRVRGRSAEVTLSWRAMKLVTESDAFVLFYYGGGHAYYLPKRVAQAGQLEELRAMIAKHTARGVWIA